MSEIQIIDEIRGPWSNNQVVNKLMKERMRFGGNGKFKKRPVLITIKVEDYPAESQENK